MTVKIKVDSSKLERDLKKQFRKAHKRKLENEIIRILIELAQATPVDTGKAQSGWRYESSGTVLNAILNKKFTIINEQDYVIYLNNGSSVQAPARFIEQVLARHGRLIPTVVEDKQ